MFPLKRNGQIHQLTVKRMQETYETDSMVQCFQQQKPETGSTEAIIILMLLDVITPQDLQVRAVLKVVGISYSL